MKMNPVDNLWTITGNPETDRVNVMKSWLCNSSDGETEPIHKYVFEMDVDKIEKLGYFPDFCGVETAFDEIVGFKHDYKVDDENLHVIAQTMVLKLDNLTKDLYENPSKYFTRVHSHKCGAFKGIACDYCTDGDHNYCSNSGDCPFKVAI